MSWWDNVKYFKPQEFAWPCCGVSLVKRDLVVKLDKIRETVGFPLIVTSGYRCSLHNSKIGGVPDSAHVKGLAADIKVTTSRQRFLVVKAALEVGFKRIGLANNFIHLDIDEDKPSEVIWLYWHIKKKKGGKENERRKKGNKAGNKKR